MSDWKDKTDFEINKAIAEIKYVNAEDIPEQCDAWTNNETECQVIIKAGIDGFMFDPCNNPSHAWPIIIENNISIRLRKGMFKDENHCNPIARSGNVWHSDKNALRAAMIVFLKLKGVKP